MSTDPPARRSEVPDSVEALNAATRAYNDAVMAFGNEPDHRELMRQRLRAFSSVPLMLMASRPYRHALGFFPELVLNLCQGRAASIELARNIIRTLPKSEVESRVVTDLESLVEGMSADEVAQLSDLLIELGLSAAVDRVRSYAADQSEEEMHQLAEDMEGVERSWRWRLSRTERIERR
ncbi:MAG: hypothetical protein WBA45_06780 [Microthrixaceae bacterium]